MTIKCNQLLDNNGSSFFDDNYCDELATVFYVTAHTIFGRCCQHKIPRGIYSTYNFATYEDAMVELVKRGL